MIMGVFFKFRLIFKIRPFFKFYDKIFVFQNLKINTITEDECYYEKFLYKVNGLNMFNCTYLKKQFIFRGF